MGRIDHYVALREKLVDQRTAELMSGKLPAAENYSPFDFFNQDEFWRENVEVTDNMRVLYGLLYSYARTKNPAYLTQYGTTVLEQMTEYWQSSARERAERETESAEALMRSVYG
jgi:hypothetical protein